MSGLFLLLSMKIPGMEIFLQVSNLGWSQFDLSWTWLTKLYLNFFQQRDCYVVLLRSPHTWWLTCDNVFVYHLGSCEHFQREGKRTGVQLWTARTIEKSSTAWWSGSLPSACAFLSEMSPSYCPCLLHNSGILNSLKQCKKKKNYYFEHIS